MYEFAARLSRGAFASGAGVMTSRRLLAVLSHPINPVLVGSVTGVELVYRVQAINIDGPVTLHYLFEGETDALVNGSVLEGNLFFNPTNLIQEVRVTTKPLSVGALDKIIVLTFSGASGATFVGDPTLTTILKSQNVSAGLNCRPDSFIIVKNTIDNVLNVLANDTARAPIIILAKDDVEGIRIASDSKTLLANAGSIVKAPFTFKYTAVVPTTAETAQATVTLEVEDVFTAQNVSVNVPYNSSRTVNVLDDTTPVGRTIVSAIGTPSDANASASIPDGGGGIRVTIPRDADTPANSFTLSFTVKHTRTNATLTRILTVTYAAAATGILRGNPGPISRLPWYSGGTHNDFNHGNMSIQVIRGKKSDISCTFGQRGKGSGTDTEEWTDIRGGEVSGIKIQGCNLGLAWAKNRAILDNDKIVPIITYDQWPFAYKRFRDNARRDIWLETAAGTHACGTLGTTDDLYDAYGAKLKRIVENYGWPAVVVRMNHECNGTASYPHFVQSVSQLDAFIAATRRCITRIKAAATSTQFQLFFCQNFARNTNGSGMAGPDAWVGKSYCDILELDFYDRNPPQPITDAASMNRYLNNTRGTSTRWKKRDGVTPLPGCNGPATWADFARQQGVGFAVGEWGVMDPSAPGHDGAEGDNPVFIEGVWNFFNSITDVLWYECYFTQSDSTLADWPLSRAKYKALWGSGGGGEEAFNPNSIISIPTLKIATANPANIIDGSAGFVSEVEQGSPNAITLAANKVCDWRGTHGRQHRDGVPGGTTYETRSTGNNACWTGGKASYISNSNLTETWKQIHDNEWHNDKALNMRDDNGGDIHIEGFYFNGVGVDGIGPPSAGNRSFRTYYRSIVMRNIRDDCFQNDSLYPISIHNSLLQGHAIISQRPGASADPPWTNFITEIKNSLIWSMRQPYDTDEKGTDAGYTGSKRVGPFISPTERNNGIVSGNGVGYASKFMHKSERISSTQVLYKLRYNIQNCVYRIDAPPVEGPRVALFPEIADGIGSGSTKGSAYNNFWVLYFGGDGWDTHWAPYGQSKANLALMGIKVIDSIAEAWDIWTSVYDLFQSSNGYNSSSDNYEWNRV